MLVRVRPRHSPSPGLALNEFGNSIVKNLVEPTLNYSEWQGYTITLTERARSISITVETEESLPSIEVYHLHNKGSELC